METAGLNYLAILVAAVAYMALGAIWFSPALFGNAWMKGIGKTKEQVTADFSPANYVVGIVTAFIASYGIARIMILTGGSTIYDGITIALLVGVCFVLTAIMVNDSFEGRQRSLTFINSLYHICGLIVAGIIISVWP